MHRLRDCVLCVCTRTPSSACVCRRYYCRHAWEVFICSSLLPKSCSEKAEGEGENKKVKPEKADNGESEEESGGERCF